MAKKSSTQIWLEYAVASGVLGLLRSLPRNAAIWLGIFVGRLAYHSLGKLRRVGLRNLELAFPEKTQTEKTKILKAAFRNLGRVMATVSQFDDLDRESITELIEYDPDPAFAAAFDRTKTDGRGRIILGGHLGNWELQAFSCPVFLEPISFLARRMDNPRIEDMILRIRTRLGNRQIDKTNSASQILRILRSGGLVGVLADVNSHPKEGVFVPFFGIPACTASGIAMLAIRANAVIVPMFAILDEERRKYVIVHGEIIEPVNSGDRKQDIVETTALCVAATERVIRKYPEQWIWIHRRWKTRPPGEKDLYE
ncbi:MAG: lysophospholipid acyltransferase family protein [Pyrinomonadaceae bacterium]